MKISKETIVRLEGNSDFREFAMEALNEIEKLDSVQFIEAKDPVQVAVEVQAKRLAIKIIGEILDPVITYKAPIEITKEDMNIKKKAYGL